MADPDFEALGNMQCPACSKRAKDHAPDEHRRCAVTLLQKIGLIPEGVHPDQVEIMTSDDMEDCAGSEEIMNAIKHHTRKQGKDASQDQMRIMLQQLLEEKFPQRPDTEDFWTMLQITAELDTKDREFADPEDFFTYLTRHTDKDSAMYVGLSRANEALLEGLSGMRQATHMLALLHAVWMDGFAVGQELQAAKR